MVDGDAGSLMSGALAAAGLFASPALAALAGWVGAVVNGTIPEVAGCVDASVELAVVTVVGATAAGALTPLATAGVPPLSTR
jgi:hypothetical protein